MREYKHRIAQIIILRNNVVAVFDQNENQMPFFQGPKTKAMPRIKRRLERQKGTVKYSVHPFADFSPKGDYVVCYA